MQIKGTKCAVFSIKYQGCFMENMWKMQYSYESYCVIVFRSEWLYQRVDSQVKT